MATRSRFRMCRCTCSTTSFHSIAVATLSMAGDVMRIAVYGALTMGVNLGAIFVPTEDILKLSASSLSAKDIAGTFLPLWYPFCGCDRPEARSPLDELAERFTRWGAAEDRDAPPCQETDPQLRRWMEGGRIDEGSLEELFGMSSVLPYEGFTPSFVMGTRITNSERPA